VLKPLADATCIKTNLKRTWKSLTSLPIKPFPYYQPLGIPCARPLGSGIIVKLRICLTPHTTLLELNEIPLPPIRPQFARTRSPAGLALELWIFLFEESSGGFNSGLFALPNILLALAFDFVKFL
jgi:hypothetical protein